MKLCIVSPSDINYPEVDQSQPENQRENITKCNEITGHQPDPGNGTASGKKQTSKPNLHLEIQTYLWPKNYPHVLTSNYLVIKLLQMNSMQCHLFFFFSPYLERNLKKVFGNCKLKQDIKESSTR